MFDNLMQSAQTRRVLSLRVINRRRISLEIERGGRPNAAAQPSVNISIQSERRTLGDVKSSIAINARVLPADFKKYIER
jgi:hypothetical protein